MSLPRTSAVAVFLAALAGLAAAQPMSRSEPLRLKPLSKDSLELLTAGVAFYPDEVLTLLAEAAQSPLAVQRAARLTPGPLAARRPQPLAVAKLQRNYPELLQLLAEQPALTAQLGVVAQQQPAQFKAAVEQHRHNWDAAAGPSSNVSTYSTEQTQKALANPATVEEFSSQMQSLESALAAGVPEGQELVAKIEGTGQAIDKTVEGPMGGKATVQGQGNGSVVATPVATKASGSAGGTVAATTPGGKTGSATGSGQATATKKGDETKVQAMGSGSATGPKGVTKNASGSMSGTITTNPEGTKSYTGEGTVTTDKGTANTSTTAGNGQASTTITTEQGSKTVTAGDGKITNQPSKPAGTQPSTNSSSQKATNDASDKPARSQSQASRPQAKPMNPPPAQKQPPQQRPPQNKPQQPKANYGQMSPQQMQQAQKAHQQSWNMTNQKVKGMQQKSPGKGRP